MTETEEEKRARLDNRNESDRASAETEKRLKKRKIALAEESD